MLLQSRLIAIFNECRCLFLTFTVVGVPLAQFCIWSPLPLAPLVPPAFTDTHYFNSLSLSFKFVDIGALAAFIRLQ